MSKVYLTVLGTGNYINCNYIFDNKEIIENKKFIQEAGVRYYCKNWSSSDKVIVFVTEEADKKNWKQNCGNGDSLFEIFIALKKEKDFTWIEPEKIKVSIPSVKTGDDIIKMFNVIFEAIPKNAEIILDITHSFRYLPMLLMSVISYTGYLKNAAINRVIYGAIEVLGTIPEIKDMNIKDRLAPVLDLTGLTDIMAWTEAVRDFTRFGNAERLGSLISKDVGIEFKNDRGDKFVKAYGEVGRYLKEISSNISTVRGEKIYNSCYKGESFSVISESTNLKIRTILPLLNEVKEKISGLEKNSFENGIIAAKWCYDYNMIQQGYTILQETVVSMICRKFDLDYKSADKRTVVSKALNVKADNIPMERWDSKLKNYKRASELVLFIDIKLAEWYKNFSNLRNNLNHAGIGKNNVGIKTFKEKLKEGIEFIERWDFI